MCKKNLLRWLHTVSHQFQQTNIHNFFDDFQDIDLHFTREKLQKQLAQPFYFSKKSQFLGLAHFHGNH